MKKIGILGTGTVGQALAGRLAGLGYEVAMGTRDVSASLGKAALSDWLKNNPSVLKSFKLLIFAFFRFFVDDFYHIEKENTSNHAAFRAA